MRKQRATWKRFLLVAVSLMLSTSSLALAVQYSTETKTRATLSKSLPTEDLLALLERHGVQPLILESDFSVGNESIHDFYLDLDKKSATEIATGYAEARRVFLEDISRLDATQTEFPDYIRRLQRSILYSLQTGNYRDIQVSTVTIKGRTVDVERFISFEGHRIGSGEPIPEGLRRDQARAVTQPVAAVASTWYPNTGTTATDQSSASERYIIQFMKWTNVSFGSEETYEHDFRLYNYDNDGTYVTMNTNFYPDCLPAVAYASTTWPASAKPYLDTRFDGPFCERDEPAFTIGVARANALVSETPYQNYMRLANGNVSHDKFKLWAQRGHRFPSQCEDTWCSYSDEFFILIPAWNSNVPGLVNWSKPAPSLSVALTATPESSPAPLNGVSLTASVSGTAQGTINYTFYCNRVDAGTDIRPGWAAKYDGISENPKTAWNVCSYPSSGTYTAKVIAERGPLAAERRTTITVTQPTPTCYTLSTSRNTASGGGVPFLAPGNSPGCSSGRYVGGQSIQVTASPAAGWRVGSWIGTVNDNSTSPVNSVVMPSTNYTVMVNYVQQTTSNSLAVSVSGAGSVFTTPAGIACPGDCTEMYVSGTQVSLDANPATGWYFSGWSGDSDCIDGVVNMVASRFCQATFSSPLPPTAAIWRSPSSLSFAATLGGASPGSQILSIARLGTGTMSWSLSDDAPWLSLSPSSGTTTDETDSINVSVNTSGLSANVYSATITINAPSATNTPQLVPVTLTVQLGQPGQAPSVTTIGVYSITHDSASLVGWINPNGLATDAYFRYGNSGNYDHATNPEGIGSGTSLFSFSQDLHNLNCETTYHFAASAYNAGGAMSGGDIVFTTATCDTSKPVVRDQSVDSITQTGATLHASVNPNGHSGTIAYFQYGTNPELFVDGTNSQPMGSGTNWVPIATSINNLTCGTTYYYSAITFDSSFHGDGTPYEPFTTTACWPSPATSFYTLTPCRILDTRNPNDPYAPAMTPAQRRRVVFSGKCGIPATAKGVSLNLTTVNPSGQGFLSLYPTVDGAPPSTWTNSFRPGQVRANNAVLSLGADGGLTVFCWMSAFGYVDFVVDVTGYFQ